MDVSAIYLSDETQVIFDKVPVDSANPIRLHRNEARKLSRCKLIFDDCFSFEADDGTVPVRLNETGKALKAYQAQSLAREKIENERWEESQKLAKESNAIARRANIFAAVAIGISILSMLLSFKACQLIDTSTDNTSQTVLQQVSESVEEQS